MNATQQKYTLLIDTSYIEVCFGSYKNKHLTLLFMREWHRIFDIYIVSSNHQAPSVFIDIIEDSGLFFEKNGARILLTVAHISRKKITTYYHLGIKQFCKIVTEVIFQKVIKGGGLYLHGSAIQTPKGAAVFLGPSGAGKSTISSLASLQFPTIADDQFYIAYTGGTYYFYQSILPESNSNLLHITHRVPLWRILFIKKSLVLNEAKPILSKSTIYRLMVSQLLTSEDGIVTSNKNLLRFVKRNKIFYSYSFMKNRKALISSLSSLG